MPQRVVVPAFADPTNTADSVAQSVSRVINEYLQSGAPGTTRAPVYPMRTPGVQPYATWPAGPIRGLFEINDHCYVVGGSTFGELLLNASGIVTYGDVGNDNQPVCMCSNGTAGHQIFIVSANNGYIFNLTARTLTQITDPNFPNPCRWGEFFAGYFIALQGAGSRAFRYSTLEDGTVWPGLNVSEISWAADNISTILRSHTELWVLGFRTSEAWVLNAGSGNNVWVPQSGVFVEHGCLGAFVAQRMDNTVFWLGQDDDGVCMVWRADGYTPRRVSTTAVETWLQRASTPTDARGFVMQMRGHIWYHLFFPRDLETTFVYDATTDRWHEWAVWDPKAARYYPHVVVNHVCVWNEHLGGSRLDGTIYRIDPDVYADTITGTLV